MQAITSTHTYKAFPAKAEKPGWPLLRHQGSHLQAGECQTFAQMVWVLQAKTSVEPHNIISTIAIV